MKLQMWAAVGLAVLLVAPAALAADSVVTVTGANFEDIVQRSPFVLMEFYASWCGHCKKLTPEYEKAAKALKGDQPPIVLAKMEATEDENKAVAAKYGVQGFPTLKIFRNGRLDDPQDYKGPRDADGIVSFLRKQAGPAYVKLSSQAEIEAFQEKDVAVIGTFKSGSKQEATFTEVADILRDDLEFALAPQAEGVSAPAVVMYKQYDDRELRYEGKWSVAPLKEWLSAKSLPLVPRLDQQPRNTRAVQQMFASPSVRVVAIVPEGHKQEAGMLAALEKSAKANPEWRHLIIDSKASSQALSFFGLGEKDVPAYVLHDAAATADTKYINKHPKPSALDAWLQKFMDGKLEKHVKSEDPPASNDGPVKVLTAKTYEELVLKSGKATLVEVYAPWCGHCKSLAPIYEKVAQALSKNKSVTVAKMDGTANDVDPALEVSGFPTIKLVKADGSIVPYAGDRSEEDLISFVEKQLSGAASSEDSTASGAAYDEL